MLLERTVVKLGHTHQIFTQISVRGWTNMYNVKFDIDEMKRVTQPNVWPWCEIRLYHATTPSLEKV